ncbi:MAG: tRNA (guanosine(37)-N1)-methyltransferase TrmD [Deltaproteobacteria bacterium]|nr:tRNA (guanosine(37)-N1)-methyltransferase TrmD [Deltaproteobacteria bacterium]
MEFEVVTLFPEMFESFLVGSILGKAREAGLIRVFFTNPRDFTSDRHRSVDDAPYGGGVGMVMKPEPIVLAIESAIAARGPAHRILLTPTGTPLTQAKVHSLAAHPRLLLTCGRYEGIDERVRELVIDEELSLGDFVLTGGEVAAMAIVDAVSRYVPGVLGEQESTAEESFSHGLLEYPQYTRPAEFRGHRVPDVLLSGNHERIREWRHEQAMLRTRERRPDLLTKAGEGADS